MWQAGETHGTCISRSYLKHFFLRLRIYTMKDSLFNIIFFFTMVLPAHSGSRPRIQFRNHFSQMVGLLGRVISQSQGRYLNTEHKHRINAYTHQKSMSWVGFEPTIQASERVKTVHALDRAATVTGCLILFFFFGATAPIGPWPTSMKLSVSLRFSKS
jgi:hypothetical protein